MPELSSIHWRCLGNQEARSLSAIMTMTTTTTTRMCGPGPS